MKRAREADGVSDLEKVKERELTYFRLWQAALRELQCSVSTSSTVYIPDEVILIMLQYLVDLHIFRKVRVAIFSLRSMLSFGINALPLSIVSLHQGFGQIASDTHVPKRHYLIEYCMAKDISVYRPLRSEEDLIRCLLETHHTDILVLQYSRRAPLYNTHSL